MVPIQFPGRGITIKQVQYCTVPHHLTDTPCLNLITYQYSKAKVYPSPCICFCHSTAIYNCQVTCHSDILYSYFHTNLLKDDLITTVCSQTSLHKPINRVQSLADTTTAKPWPLLICRYASFNLCRQFEQLTRA